MQGYSGTATPPGGMPQGAGATAPLTRPLERAIEGAVQHGLAGSQGAEVLASVCCQLLAGVGQLGALRVCSKYTS